MSRRLCSRRAPDHDVRRGHPWWVLNWVGRPAGVTTAGKPPLYGRLHHLSTLPATHKCPRASPPRFGDRVLTIANRPPFVIRAEPLAPGSGMVARLRRRGGNSCGGRWQVASGDWGRMLTNRILYNSRKHPILTNNCSDPLYASSGLAPSLVTPHAVSMRRPGRSVGETFTARDPLEARVPTIRAIHKCQASRRVRLLFGKIGGFRKVTGP